MIESFSKSLQVTNTYRGELLGLMAIHLILLSVDRIHGAIAGNVEVVSDCLGALRWVVDLPPYQIPSRCKHSDIFKKTYWSTVAHSPLRYTTDMSGHTKMMARRSRTSAERRN
jgi:hypothetical protein